MKKWEYIVSLPSIDETATDHMNRMGSEGWELVSVEAYNTFYFKREKQ